MAVRTPPAARGFLVMLGLALILVIIVVAAYHGSDQVTPSECSQASTVLRQAGGDIDGARQTFTATGTLPAAQVATLERDDDTLNQIATGATSSEIAFDNHTLPLVEDLGRLLDDVHSAPSHVTSDFASLAAADEAATTYCGLST